MTNTGRSAANASVAYGALQSHSPAPRFALVDGLVFAMDALDFLRSIRGNVADLVFLDPPFNLGKRYGHRSGGCDRLSDQAYEELLKGALTESVRVLKPGGSLFVYHVPGWAIKVGAWLQDALDFRHWIAVSMKGGFPTEGKLYPAHYALLYYTKGEPDIFSRPKIPPALCRHCGKAIKDYGGYWKNIEGGLNLSDVWEDLSPVRHKRNKNRTSNELPLALPRRIVEMAGENGGLVVDPFAGAGTMLVAAREAGMQFLACDREESCCDVIARRLGNVERAESGNG